MGLLLKLLGIEPPHKQVKMSHQGIEFFAPAPISNEDYQRKRAKEERWLEKHYDFNSIHGVQSIPEKVGLPRPPTIGVTGDVDYYLRKKGFEHERNGQIELAIQCLRKSNAIRAVASPVVYRKEDFYALPKMLARNGFEDAAWEEKHKIDRFFGDRTDNPDDVRAITLEIRRWNDQRAFLWLQQNYPDKCPKSISGFRRMKTQETKKYQELKELLIRNGFSI